MEEDEIELCSEGWNRDDAEGCLRLPGHTTPHAVGVAINGSFTIYELCEDRISLKPIIKADTEGKFTKQEMAAMLAVLDIRAGK